MSETVMQALARAILRGGRPRPWKVDAATHIRLCEEIADRRAAEGLPVLWAAPGEIMFCGVPVGVWKPQR